MKGKTVSVTQAAQELHTSLDYVGRLLREGKLEGKRELDEKTGRNLWRVSKASVDAKKEAMERRRIDVLAGRLDLDKLVVAEWRRGKVDADVQKQLIDRCPDGISIRAFNAGVVAVSSGQTTVEKQLAAWRRLAAKLEKSA